MLLQIAWVVVTAMGVGLPNLQQHVADRRPAAVEHPALQSDALSLGLRLGQHVAEVVFENLEAGRQRRKADMHIRPGGLRRRFRQIR
ncbi:hypothetical protein D3C71_1582850 [compost metagenome]